MALVFEEVRGVVAHVGALDVLDVHALVQVLHQVLKRVDEQVAAALVGKRPERGHPGPDDRYGPGELALAGG